MSLPTLPISDLEEFLRKCSIDGRYLRSKFILGLHGGGGPRTTQPIIWVDNIQAHPCLDLHQISRECKESIELATDNEQQYRRAWVFVGASSNHEHAGDNPKACILILEVCPTITDDGEAVLYSPRLPWRSLLPSFKYERLDIETDVTNSGYKNLSRRFRIVVFIAALLLSASFIFVYLTRTETSHTWPEDGYIKYPTTGSAGPKRQLRIYYQNATEWSQQNPHANGEWRIRMDDQALIPAEAWDPDEDQYQQWFHSRYKEMHEVIEKNWYIRPSWLGSLDIIVPWDEEFHRAHCVVALRRYWKAKESGKHVCPRDIAYHHIEHCLNWFEATVFSPDTKSLPKMGTHMIWQTKVCF